MATHKKQAAKPTKNAKASATKAKKAAPAKKVVASKTKGTPAKKAANLTLKTYPIFSESAFTATLYDVGI